MDLTTEKQAVSWVVLLSTRSEEEVIPLRFLRAHGIHLCQPQMDV